MIKQWSLRTLTGVGRFVVKPLIVSKITHLLFSLPNPSIKMLNV